MVNDSEEMIDVFEKLTEAGKGVLAISPQTEKEREERDRLVQDYLRQRKSLETHVRQK